MSHRYQRDAVITTDDVHFGPLIPGEREFRVVALVVDVLLHFSQRPVGHHYSHTMPSLSASFMYWYAGWPRRTGAIPWFRASAQVIRPFLLSSHMASASMLDGAGSGEGDSSAEAGTITISIDEHPERTASKASASLWSMVRPYASRTRTTLSANQHWFRSGSHSAPSLPLFWWRLTLGLASVRFRMSPENRLRVAASVAHSPTIVSL